MDYIKFNEIIANAKINKNFTLKYLTTLFYDNYIDLKYNIKCSCPLLSIHNFIPLPNRFLLDEKYVNDNKVVKNNNTYSFYGIKGNRILFSNKILPYSTNKMQFPIPFSFPIITNNIMEICQSNIFYYEITIENVKNIPESWDDECISIGFGTREIPFESHTGWHKNSIGYHSDDGIIRLNNNIIKKSKKWTVGDTVGAGIIYISKNLIVPFFTFNGKLIYKNTKITNINTLFFPMIGYDHSYSFSTNFSTQQFKFDIKNLINQYSNCVISTNNDFYINKNVADYFNFPPIQNSMNINIYYKIIINKINIENENKEENIINLIN